MADFKSFGNTPVDKTELILSVMTGATEGRTLRRRLVGIGSREHEALEDFLITEIISEIEAA